MRYLGTNRRVPELLELRGHSPADHAREKQEVKPSKPTQSEKSSNRCYTVYMMQADFQMTVTSVCSWLTTDSTDSQGRSNSEHPVGVFLAMCCCDNPSACACGKCKKPVVMRHYDKSDLTSVYRGSFEGRVADRVMPKLAANHIFELSERLYGGAGVKFDAQSTSRASYRSPPPPAHVQPATAPAKAEPKPTVKFEATSKCVPINLLGYELM